MNALAAAPVVAVCDRGGLAESWHRGAAAVAAPDGRLLATVGDPRLTTFLRSSAKPLQTLPLLAAGGAAAFDLSDADLALVCASHGGTPRHALRAAAILDRAGLSVADLLCGAHLPLDAAAAAALQRRGEAPTALHNNCSGKHAGMLLACRLLGWPTAGYTAVDHPLQRRILEVVATFSGVPPEGIGNALDGCSLPTFHLPLAAAARAWAALADPDAADLPDELRRPAAAAIAAMGAAPFEVAGPGRFTTRLMEVTEGRVVGKEGAEGIYAVAVRDAEPRGVVLKVLDGGDRCRDAFALEVLHQLGALRASELDALAAFHRPERRNHRGLLVGHIVPQLALQEVG